MARDMVPEAEVPTSGYVSETRERWIAELRRQGSRQCTNGCYQNGVFVCALGLLREVAFPDWSEFDRDTIDDVGEVGALAGLTEDQSTEITLRNDGSPEHDYRVHTFAEIADVVESWFR